MEKYHLSIRVLHWLVAACVIGMLILGFLMDSRDQYNLHKSIGVSILILMAIRIISRLSTKTPDFPEQIKNNEAILAKLGHFALYAFLIIMPLSGWLMSNFGGHAVKLFGLEVFTLVEKNKELGKLAREAHEIIAYILIFLISIHVLAALKHLIMDKVNLLKRIM